MPPDPPGPSQKPKNPYVCRAPLSCPQQHCQDLCFPDGTPPSTKEGRTEQLPRTLLDEGPTVSVRRCCHLLEFCELGRPQLGRLRGPCKKYGFLHLSSTIVEQFIAGRSPSAGPIRAGGKKENIDRGRAAAQGTAAPTLEFQRARAVARPRHDPSREEATPGRSPSDFTSGEETHCTM